MKDITGKLQELLKEGYCTPQIARIAKKTHDPSTTIHYNIKKLEKEGKILTYKAVFDYAKIDQGFCSFVLISLTPDKYNDPEKIAHKIASRPEVESCDIITGDWELVIKVRTSDQNAYYQFVKQVLSQPGIAKTKSLVSFKQIKTEFVESQAHL
ncbi:MAG: Lrp/AsnC family transcriptional regulator [Candidatus Woesearchaeota archaeon]|jgi:DNA-binding Lrp family transcriptional regulator|nr:Lrp/AsnC family transcriptional regulator [Candidatus Woesearchaeota archaeon]MDP7181148.1 Lrp/AsnC family transcriptional regulator [Candidatus Woesearchaeota archaeon]MDP7198231.1 Lrp/AsnC family transcriptional regulator [Candidatus Woesearchaeota archaeon]MDP7467067.1 Lrp/AsnC family transcriptional regulator [Candidatus Woesearchaeota archaeon]MDP7646735.1 Lrp/AsnC family transcriptional regulator [Candidatus Woesearchaeota archaeon]|tara:strand:+ start:794 stop:1255 length:462 start_codon:yes stop_codon:yes gene_type:complete